MEHSRLWTTLAGPLSGDVSRAIAPPVATFGQVQQSKKTGIDVSKDYRTLGKLNRQVARPSSPLLPDYPPSPSSDLDSSRTATTPQILVLLVRLLDFNWTATATTGHRNPI
ncbi:hypothetical protein FS837_000489 [Tulasnella sp. UAMH 9824]|nr:hypothetical protein FS837_000489 [Tulasnella sp. UAMH 9824]